MGYEIIIDQRRVAMGIAPKGGFLRLFTFFFFLSALVVGIMGESASQTARFGDFFPQYVFDSPAASGDRAYLGIPDGKTFTIGDIQADLIVLEVLNTYCTSCQIQAPIYNKVFRLMENDPVTKGRIKWMGVGVGNNKTEVGAFRKEKQIQFPILTDLNFEFYDAVGGPGGVRTPLTILVRKDEKGRGIVVESHVGFRRDQQEILQGIKAVLLYDLAYLKIKEGERTVLPVTKKLKPPLSDEDLLQKIRDGMAIAGASVMEIRKIHLEEEVVYMGKLQVNSQEKQLFAKIVSSPPVCDICHDIHFIYIFNEEGKIINFIPIYLTKYGNRLWNDNDIEKMKSRLIGRSLLDPFQFDRDVDAVTKATITSVVIFEGMNKGKSIYTNLRKKNYLK